MKLGGEKRQVRHWMKLCLQSRHDGWPLWFRSLVVCFQVLLLGRTHNKRRKRGSDLSEMPTVGLRWVGARLPALSGSLPGDKWRAEDVTFLEMCSGVSRFQGTIANTFVNPLTRHTPSSRKAQLPTTVLKKVLYLLDLGQNTFKEGCQDVPQNGQTLSMFLKGRTPF